MTTRARAAAVALMAAVVAAPRAYDLDIAEKRITETDFHASTALRAGTAESGIQVRAGASATARAIDLVLRNVRGTVRFRADTSRLQRDRIPHPDPTPDPAPINIER